MARHSSRCVADCAKREPAPSLRSSDVAGNRTREFERRKAGHMRCQTLVTTTLIGVLAVAGCGGGSDEDVATDDAAPGETVEATEPVEEASGKRRAAGGEADASAYSADSDVATEAAPEPLAATD